MGNTRQAVETLLSAYGEDCEPVEPPKVGDLLDAFEREVEAQVRARVTEEVRRYGAEMLSEVRESGQSDVSTSVKEAAGLCIVAVARMAAEGKL